MAGKILGLSVLHGWEPADELITNALFICFEISGEKYFLGATSHILLHFDKRGFTL